MKIIDSIDKQIFLEKFLSPLRTETTNNLNYLGRWAKVYFQRFSSGLYHLFHLKLKWQNNQYVAYKVT